MSRQTSTTQRRSRWSYFAGGCFLLAAVAFLVAWNRPVSSGIGQLLSRSAALVSFSVLWSFGAVSVGLAALQAWRNRWTPLVGKLSVVLGLVSLAACGWIVFGRATPERLVLSARGGDVAWVERCLNRGVDVDARFEELLGFGGYQQSATPLGAAAETGHLEVVRLLVKAGADLEAEDNGKRTSLERAILYGHVEVVEFLLEAGARLVPSLPVSDPDASRATLFLTIHGPENLHYPFERMVRSLIERGANPNVPYILQSVMWAGDPDTARRWLTVTPDPSPELDPWTPLLRALVRQEDDEALRLLAVTRAHPGEAPITEDAELLQLGAKFGCTSFVRSLLDEGLPVDVPFPRNSTDLTALHHAVLGNQAETVAFLIERGADMERQDGTWGSALHRACYEGHAEVVAALISGGAQVDALRCEGIPLSPLFSCVASGSVACARTLLEAGANAKLLDGNGRTLAERAETYGKRELAEFFGSWPGH